MSEAVRIAVAYGEGVGPEIMNAAMLICQKAEVDFGVDIIQLGEEYYRGDYINGVSPESWNVLHRNKILFKSPTLLPKLKGKQSLEVSLKHILGTNISVRPIRTYAPSIHTNFPDMDIVLISGNAEGIYSTTEYRYSEFSYHNTQSFSKAGWEQVVRYAFDYAKAHNRQKVTCVGKADVLAFSEGVLRDMFKSIAKEYDDIEADYEAIDHTVSYMLIQPDQYDVVVTTDVFGDILASIASRITRCNEVAGAMHIGENGYAIFEPAHSALASIEEQGLSNPSGIINSLVMMLLHLGKNDKATLIHNAWLKTIEDGIHTPECFVEGVSKKVVGVDEFTEAVCERLEQEPETLTPVHYSNYTPIKITPQKTKQQSDRVLVGADIFVDPKALELMELVAKVQAAIQNQPLQLQVVDSRGVKIWPGEHPAAIINDIWRLRFVPSGNKVATHKMINALLEKLEHSWLEVVKTEHLYVFNGKLGFTLPLGEK